MDRNIGDKWALPAPHRDFVAHWATRIREGETERGRQAICGLILKTMWAKNVLVQAGLALDEDGELPMVIGFWEQAVQLDPLDLELTRMLKARYGRNGRHEKVTEYNEKIRWIEHVQALADDAEQALRDGDYEAACALLRQLIDLRPEVATYYADLGECLLELGRYAEAQELFELLMKGSSHPLQAEEFERELARALFGLGKIEEAKAILQRNNFLTRQAKHDKLLFPKGYTVSQLTEVDIHDLRDADHVTFHELEANTLVTQYRPNVIPPMTEIPEQFELERNGLYVAELRSVEVLTHDGLIVDDNRLVRCNPALSARSKQDNIHFFTRCYNERHETLVMTPERHTLRLEKAALITSRVFDNYFHWLLEGLPRLFLLDALEQHQDAPILIRQDMPPQHFEALKMVLGDRREVILLDAHSRVSVEHLIVPALTGYNPPEYYYYVRNGRTPPFSLGIHPYAINKVRNTMLKLVDPPPSEKRTRLFMPRPETGIRGCCNELVLQDLFKQLGFELFEPQKYSLREQISLVSSAEILVGNVGAAFTNMVFAPSDCQVIGLQNETANPEMLDKIARVLGQRFTVIRGRSIPNTGNQIHSHFHMDPEYLMEQIRQLMAEHQWAKALELCHSGGDLLPAGSYSVEFVPTTNPNQFRLQVTSV